MNEERYIILDNKGVIWEDNFENITKIWENIFKEVKDVKTEGDLILAKVLDVKH